MSPLSGVLTETWALYRRYAAHFLLIAFVIYLTVAILVGLLSLAGWFGNVLGLIIELAALFLLQAALVKAVQDVRDGRVDLNLSQTFQAALPYLLPVAGAGILAAIGIAIGLALLIVPGLILLTFWCLIVPFIVIGETGPIDAFSKSMRTVRGYAWNVFGTLVLPFLALVITLIYYRLMAAHASQPYTTTGPEGTTVWEPPYPTTPGDSTATRTPRPPGRRPQGRHAPVLHAARTHATGSHGARPGHPTGPRPRSTASSHPLTARTEHSSRILAMIT